MTIQTCRKTQRKIIIIGGGALGLSSGWHLVKDQSNDVTIYDHPNETAPSRDVSKILRIDYPDPRRMRTVLRSKELWENDNVFRPFYYRTGRIVAYSKASVNTLDSIDDARSSLNLPVRKRYALQHLKEIFESNRTEPDLTVVENEDDGVLDWTGAMESIREDCIEKGAKFRNDMAVHLVPGEDGNIHKIVTSNGFIDTTNTIVVLAVGPWIMPLLEASSIQLPPASRAPVATGIFSFTLELSVSQWEKYRRLPVFSEIGVGEFLCHPTQVGSAKLTWIKPFRHPLGEKAISSPWDAARSDLALQSLIDAKSWIRKSLPGLTGARIKDIRSWWDGVTEDQNPLIAQHPEHINLFIAGGASYTHAKDLPEIGRIVADLLSGDEAESFGWAAPSVGKHSANQPALRAVSDFKCMDQNASSQLKEREDVRSRYTI